MRVMIRMLTTTYAESVISTPSCEIVPPSGPMLNGTTYMVRPLIDPSKSGRRVSPHLVRGHPVVGRAGVLFALGADVGAVLDPGDVLGVGAREEAVRALLLVQLDERAGLDELGGQPVPLLLRAVGPDHAVGLGEGGDLLDPGQQLGVLGGSVGKTGNRHRNLSSGDAAGCASQGALRTRNPPCGWPQIPPGYLRVCEQLHMVEPEPGDLGHPCGADPAPRRPGRKSALRPQRDAEVRLDGRRTHRPHAQRARNRRDHQRRLEQGEVTSDAEPRTGPEREVRQRSAAALGRGPSPRGTAPGRTARGQATTAASRCMTYGDRITVAPAGSSKPPRTSGSRLRRVITQAGG